MKPSVGRIVHYVAYGHAGRELAGGRAMCRAAIITEVNAPPAAEGYVSLCVLNPTGQFFNRSVPQHEGEDVGHGKIIHNAGTWHWPERVE